MDQVQLTDENKRQQSFDNGSDQGAGQGLARSTRAADNQRLTGMHLTSAAHAAPRQDTTLFSPLTGENDSFSPGDIIHGDYQLIALLGRGGMGVVFSCKHLAMEQTYALKILSGKQLDSEAWSRFQAARRGHGAAERAYDASGARAFVGISRIRDPAKSLVRSPSSPKAAGAMEPCRQTDPR